VTRKVHGTRPDDRWERKVRHAVRRCAGTLGSASECSDVRFAARRCPGGRDLRVRLRESRGESRETRGRRREGGDGLRRPACRYVRRPRPLPDRAAIPDVRLLSSGKGAGARALRPKRESSNHPCSADDAPRPFPMRLRSTKLRMLAESLTVGPTPAASRSAPDLRALRLRGEARFESKPVVFVSLWNAACAANGMNHGQPAGAWTAAANAANCSNAVGAVTPVGAYTNSASPKHGLKPVRPPGDRPPLAGGKKEEAEPDGRCGKEGVLLTRRR